MNMLLAKNKKQFNEYTKNVIIRLLIKIRIAQSFD